MKNNAFAIAVVACAGCVAAHAQAPYAPFTAKLNSAFAPYTEYDQLMRLEEWFASE